jgi:hypothetical protein
LSEEPFHSTENSGELETVGGTLLDNRFSLGSGIMACEICLNTLDRHLFDTFSFSGARGCRDPKSQELKAERLIGGMLRKEGELEKRAKGHKAKARIAERDLERKPR